MGDHRALSEHMDAVNARRRVHTRDRWQDPDPHEAVGAHASHNARRLSRRRDVGDPRHPPPSRDRSLETGAGLTRPPAASGDPGVTPKRLFGRNYSPTDTNSDPATALTPHFARYSSTATRTALGGVPGIARFDIRFGLARRRDRS